MHAKIENGLVVEYPIINLRQRLPEVSLPADLTNDAALPDGFVYVGLGQPPEYNADTHKLVPGCPLKNAKGCWVMSYDVVSLSEEELVQRQNQLFQSLKDARQVEVDALTVTTQSGNAFDGNEEAQGRMSRAILAMNDVDRLPWVLADNTVALVERSELQEALRLAGLAMAYIWVKPYSTE